MNVQHGGQSDIVLVPQPTTDPNDPLNWSRGRKEYHFWLLWFWGFIAAVSVNWSGPVWTQFTIDLNTDYTQLNVSSALCFLFLGVGCVILQPTALKIGRRPIYIIGTLFNFVGCIWGGVMTDIQSMFGVNILTGFGAAPVDSLVEISTMDIFFQHQRGTRLALFLFAIYAGSYLGPVATGYIATSQDWRWCFWYLVIFFGVLLVLQLLTLEESNFRRPHAQPQASQPAARDIEDELMKVPEQSAEAAKGSESELTPFPSRTPTIFGPTKTFVQKLRLWDTTQNDPRPWWLIAIRPAFIAYFPAVIWAGLIYGVQIMWLSLLATTQSLIFSSDPYDFSVENVGNTNFAAFIGGILGMVMGGYGSDKITLILSRRNSGILEPEMRLWAMIPPAIINTAGLLMYGVGAAQGASWVLCAGFGTGCIAFGIGSGGAIAITYAVDCYPDIASESLVLMLFVRNCIGAGFTFAIQPWLDAQGLQTTSIIMAVICLVFNMSFLLFTWKGKEFRRWTAGRYYEFADQAAASLIVGQ